jgi:glucokinase
MRSCVVGVDLGGTNVRAGAFWEDGTPAGADVSRPSNAQEGAEATLDAVAHAIVEAAEAGGAEAAAVGVAIPGHIDNARGLVRWAPNFGREVDGVFRYWQDVPFQEMLAARLAHGDASKLAHSHIVMDNDANMAALGEYRFGTGRGKAKCLVMITVGTGIGGGVILSPEAVLGDARGPLVMIGGNGGGAELGHTVINYQGLDAHVGSYGAVEAYCQRDGIVARACHRAKRRPGSMLEKLVEGDLSRISPRTITEAAEVGCELATEVWDEVGTMLGVGIGNFINVFAPDIVAVGGQISKAGRFLLEPAIRSARNVAIPSLFADALIVQAEQIEDAGMLGAAALALMRRK